MSTRARWLLFGFLIVVMATVASAETVMTEVKSGTVVAVSGNMVAVRLQDGTVKTFDVPPDFRFNVDGQQVAAKDLRPGTKLTATVKTTTAPATVTSEEIKNGEVLQKKGNILIVRTEKGVKQFNVPDDYKFFVDGKWIDATQLQPKMMISATMISTTHPMVVTDKEVQIAGNAPPPPPPKPKPAAAAPPPPPPPPPPPEPAKKLPKTASPLPLIGLSGLLALASGLGMRIGSRRRS